MFQRTNSETLEHELTAMIERQRQIICELIVKNEQLRKCLRDRDATQNTQGRDRAGACAIG
jgi:hypothetical protein